MERIRYSSGYLKDIVHNIIILDGIKGMTNGTWLEMWAEDIVNGYPGTNIDQEVYMILNEVIKGTN
jgi:hypothetical protein